MELGKIQLKDIKTIEFNVNNLTSLQGSSNKVDANEAKIDSVVLERDKLKVIVKDSKNKVYFRVSAKSKHGKNILGFLVLSKNLIGLPFDQFAGSNLEDLMSGVFKGKIKF